MVELRRLLSNGTTFAFSANAAQHNQHGDQNNSTQHGNNDNPYLKVTCERKNTNDLRTSLIDVKIIGELLCTYDSTPSCSIRTRRHCRTCLPNGAERYCQFRERERRTRCFSMVRIEGRKKHRVCNSSSRSLTYRRMFHTFDPTAGKVP